MGLEEFVRLAADAGFAGADVDLEYAETMGIAALHDLYVGAGLRFGGWGPPGNWRGDESKFSEGVKKLRAQARIARELVIDSCATWIMPSAELPFMANWNFHVSRLKPIAAALGDEGLRFGLEFVAPYHLRRKFAHEFIFSPGLMLELADAIGPNVGLLVDCFHCYAGAVSWEHLGQIPARKIVLAHVNDCPAGPLEKVEDGKRVLPGEGVIEQGAFLSALRTAGYNGPVSVEVFSEELRAMKPEVAARKAGAAVKAILPEWWG